jgi:hypothetical protein
MHIIYNNNNNNSSNHVTFSCNTSQLKQDTLFQLDIMNNQMEKLLKIFLRQDTLLKYLNTNIKHWFCHALIFYNMRRKVKFGLLWSNKGPSWSWSYVSWIYYYLCNQCLSLLKLWVRIPLSRGVLETTLCDKAGLWLAAGRLFSPWPPRYNWNWNIVESGVKHYNPP